MNTAVIIGNLTRDVETRQSNAGAVAKFTVAVNRIRSKNEEGVDYLPVVTFGKLAENCGMFLSKGKKVAVQGRIQTGSYENKEGQRVYTTEIIAENVEFLSPKDSGATFAGIPDDRMPF